MPIEINSKNYNKPKKDKPPIKNNNYNPPKQERITWTHILSFIIVMIIWFIMEVGY